MIIREIHKPQVKQTIAAKILLDLPEWFGIEESTKEYIENVAKYPFVAAFDESEPIGFYSLREENKDVLDMYVLGVLKKYHKKGVGTLLQKYVDEYAKNHQYKYMMVLTLAEKVQNKEYLLTRNFYLKMNFTDFFQNDSIFDEFNPCQIMIKQL